MLPDLITPGCLVSPPHQKPFKQQHLWFSEQPFPNLFLSVLSWPTVTLTRFSITIDKGPVRRNADSYRCAIWRKRRSSKHIHGLGSYYIFRKIRSVCLPFLHRDQELPPEALVPGNDRLTARNIFAETF